MDKLCQKHTLFEKLKTEISGFSTWQKKILLADLASAEKITLTIREEKIKKSFWKQNYFFKKICQNFSEKSEFLGDKKIDVEK